MFLCHGILFGNYHHYHYCCQVINDQFIMSTSVFVAVKFICRLMTLGLSVQYEVASFRCSKHHRDLVLLVVLFSGLPGWLMFPQQHPGSSCQRLQSGEIAGCWICFILANQRRGLVRLISRHHII